MIKEKYCVIVWDSVFGLHPNKYLYSYKDLCEYIERYNDNHIGVKFLYSVYRRDFKNKKWVYMGGFDHA